MGRMGALHSLWASRCLYLSTPLVEIRLLSDKTKVKSPIFPLTPVKVYEDAGASKKDITKDFKGVPLIYMWFNKITGKVYIGSSIDGSKRLAGYYQLSILKKKSIIYQSILKKWAC